MKRILLSLTVILLAMSMHAQSGYVISGTAEGTVDGDTVYLAQMQGYFQFAPEDTTIIKNGKFQFKGSMDGAELRFICPIHKGQMTNTAMFILENAPIDIQIPADQNKQATVKGGPSQADFQAYNHLDDADTAVVNKDYEIANDSTKSEAIRKAAQSELDSLGKIQANRHYDFIIKRIPSAIADMLLVYNMDAFSEQQLNDVLDRMGKADKQYGHYKSIMAERKASAATAIGQKYTDIALKGTDGKTVKVSTYVTKNKLTLIDFWASWCGPCRAEMPNVVAAYSKYHAKGFEVVGVSLDNNKESWLKAIKQLKMPWPQMSDLKGWQSAGAAAYNVKAIPTNALVDQKGNIIAKDLRGEDLMNKLAELLH